MSNAAVFSVPQRHPMLLSDAALATMPDFDAEVVQWATRVNERAGRAIVTSSGGQVRFSTSGSAIKPGRLILILDGDRVTQTSTFRIIDRLEMLS